MNMSCSNLEISITQIETFGMSLIDILSIIQSKKTDI